MASALQIPLGAPGIYRLPDVPLRALTGVRMDVCAFLGVAPRGPAREPVLDEFRLDCQPDQKVTRQLRRTVPVDVESFDEYRRLFGGFEGPGLLPYAVASFFEQGGKRAYVARIVHEYGTAENSGRVAQGTVAGVTTSVGPLKLRARNEGAWGNHLRVAVELSYTPLNVESASTTGLTIPKGEKLTVGTLLRLTLGDGSTPLRFVAQVSVRGRPSAPGAIREVTLDAPVLTAPERVDVVEGVMTIDDGDGRQEVFSQLGLSSIHPRWTAYVLCHESRLVYPDESWLVSDVTPKEDEPGAAFEGGVDAYEAITPADFFDDTWTLGDDEAGDGVTSLTQLADLSLLVLPDLYSPAPLVPPVSVDDPVSLAGPAFERCVDLQVTPPQQEFPPPDLDGLRLDPRDPADLEEILFWQSKLVDFTSVLQSFVVLLDVPPGLHQRQILAWRTKFDSAYAAAYHPWLTVSRRDDSRDALVRIPPSSPAAGIIAQREIAEGVPHGPANVLAAEIVDVDDVVSPARHDELHPHGINVYLRERDGIRLTAARTLSLDPQWRQLSVRRLITMLRRTLEQQTQWMVFEPNNAALRSEIRKLLGAFLRKLYRAGAFRGATEEEAFFVQCDDALNPPAVVDQGRVIANIGVAPAEPLEFIVLRLSRDGDGTLSVED